MRRNAVSENRESARDDTPDAVQPNSDVDEELRERALSGFGAGADSGWEPSPADVRRRVDIAEVGVDEAKALMHRSVALMGALLPCVDAYDYGQLARSAAELVVSEQCREGLDLDALCAQAHVGRGRLGERFDPLWHVASGTVIRAALASFARHVFYEEISSVPTRVRRRDNGIATDKHPGTANSRHLIVHSLGCGERLVPARVGRHRAGTRDCLERWEADCGPGLLKARNAKMMLGASNLLNVANNAIVEAHRRGQRR
jgi:hypothetical protein